jgi:hypothetical protein
MPASSLFLINPLGDLLEICCRSEMSRSSAKIRDHVVITLIPGADPPPLQREVIFSRLFVFPEFIFPEFVFPEFASGSSLPAAGSYHSGSPRPR